MDKKGINVIEENLKKYNGESVVISTSHKLYGGNQKIKCNLNYIFDEERIGFKINEQEIFVYRNNFFNFGIEDGIYLADDLMEIKIKIV